MKPFVQGLCVMSESVVLPSGSAKSLLFKQNMVVVVNMPSFLRGNPLFLS